MESTFLAAVTQVSERHWHALSDDRVVGRGEVSRRPDGRPFVSIDAWHGSVFDQLAEAMLTRLPRPLYTVVDEADLDLLSSWERCGFGPRRREWEYVMPTDPRLTGLDPAPPPGLTILGAGEAGEDELRELDRAVRDEVEATLGWQNMPAEVLSRPDGSPLLDPARYTVAVESGRYVGLARVAPLPRQPRIGLIAVRAGRRRRGIGRALLAEVLGAAHRRGLTTASADVNQSNSAAIALFEGAGARKAGSNLELVLR
ncbi:ribosomal-protein-alanine N-acetyltransferase [Actinoplanes ianthinogenes]|uniref:Ribosomal-protein-alanine N-acetyltransferase n=1 Tax=Actinoplanes ianthinogenes TaxID=122358 RepID=A0ABM7M6D7_9ACTN|nr:GNAT family N-acetyltransferase [Actinoplanes ianthinogenes]BCJ47141.1 ribosomal-protein-alanine N-acetyltransferase [Actinoplanes ianthinogenes]GGR51978.1 ribosomal-protein-alanine N-acetyltransferase [Actinoplanes ianthinogenes]